MFDAVLHHPIRTKIISILASTESVAYRELKDLTGLTDGNLAGYLRSLEDAQYIEFEKLFDGRKPKTIYKLSPKGRQAFLDYIDELAHFVKNSRDDR